MAVDDLVRCVEAGEAPEGGFHHVHHLQLAWRISAGGRWPKRWRASRRR